MSGIRHLFAFLLANAVVPAFAQTAPMTVQEWTNRQAEIKRAEMESKLEEQRLKLGAGAAPVRMARTCDDDLSLYAVYGIGAKLRADFGYRGATITLAPGDRADIGGWQVVELTPTRAVMVKRNGKNGASPCPVYLSGGRQYAPSSSLAAVGADNSVQVPPIMPAAGPASAGAAKAAEAHGGAQ